jgi:Leucine-rich repeat (LRR) protein
MSVSLRGRDNVIVWGDSIAHRSGSLSVALSSNLLTSLPQSFELLERLRYLNLRQNSFSTFPDVVRDPVPTTDLLHLNLPLSQLTELPSLEILDISRNYLTALPARPGYLKNLRVSIIRTR